MKKRYILSAALFGTATIAMAQNEAIEANDTCAHLNEIVVTSLTGNALLKQTPTPITTVSASEIATKQYSNIIDALSRQPGVSQITTGSGISKPVIRGLGYNRLLVIDRGVRQEGQQWGDEHGIEVDAHSVGSVEIQKGPATLLYGSDALAGVLIFRDPPMRIEGEHRLNASTEYQTNAGLFGYSLNAEGNHKGLLYNWRWSQKMAHDYKNPYDGYVPGTRFQERALSGMLGLNRSWVDTRLRLGYYHLTPGIVEGERDAETGELERTDNGKHYSAALPFQEVRHYKAVLDNTFRLGASQLKAILGYQQNRRQEYEESAQEPGLDFKLHTASYDLRWVAPTWAEWRTNVGVGGMYQRSENLGEEFLIPAYHLFDFGLFATASRSWGERLHLSGGLRYDVRSLHSHAREEEWGLRFADFSRTFQGLTGSVGLVYNLRPDWDIRFNVARGYRAPNLSELGSNGVHEGTLRYEQGNHQLNPEFSWQMDLGMQYASEHFSAEISLFANHIQDYIYVHGVEGEEREGQPLFSYAQGDARVVGGEARVVVHPVRYFHIDNSFSYVSKVLLHQPEATRYLPFTPAPRWVASVHYHLPLRSQTLRDAYVSAEMDYNFKQSHIYREGDTETVSPGYALFNLSLGTDIHHRGRRLLTLSLSATNLLNRAYQSHLSRLRMADVNSLTGRRGIYNPGRNIGIKVSVPIEL